MGVPTGGPTFSSVREGVLQLRPVSAAETPVCVVPESEHLAPQAFRARGTSAVHDKVSKENPFRLLIRRTNNGAVLGW